MTTAMWGCGDGEVIDRVRRLLYVAMTEHDKMARLAERCGEDECDVVVAQVLTRHSHDDVTPVSSAQASHVSVCSSLFTTLCLCLFFSELHFNCILT